MNVRTLIGESVHRAEDFRFLKGAGRFVDDLQREGMLHAVVLRSPVAHGRIRKIDASAARAMPGVHAVMTAAEIGACAGDPAAARQPAGVQELSAAGHRQRQGPLCRRAGGGGGGGDARAGRGRARGDRSSISSGCRRCRTGMWRRPTRRCCSTASATARCATSATFGDADAAFAKAEYTRKETFRCHRLTGLPLETRGQISEWDAAKKRLTVFGATKVLFFNRRTLAPMLGVTEADIDMIEVDVGGGFGVKGEFYPEDFLIPFAARLVGRPVKWIEDRREHLDRDQPFARGRLRAGNRLQARRHDPRHARARQRRHGRLYPHQRRRGAGQGGAVPAGAVPHPRHRADGGGLRHQQDAGRHLARAGAVRGEFLPRAIARHRCGRSRPRSDGVPAQESHQGGGAAVSHRQARALRAGNRFRHRRLSRHLRARGGRDRLGQEQVDAGQADRRPLSRASPRCRSSRAAARARRTRGW